MKFTEAQHIEILSCVSKAGLLKSQFSFRKKRGWIFVHHNESKDWFSFFYRNQSYIDLKTAKRIETGIWEVNSSSGESDTFDNWDEVVKKLNLWLTPFK